MDERICSGRDCTRRAVVRGWCKKHYDRWHRHGDPDYWVAPYERLNERERRNSEEIANGVRRCKTCGETKPLEQFYPSATNRGGRHIHCDTCRNARMATWHAAKRQRDPERYSRKFRNTYLKRTYGISVDEYDGLVESQGGRCATCGRVQTLVIDHDHETNSRRELLCNDCNLALGHVRDDPTILRNLILYLDRHTRSQRALESEVGSEA